ncbi:MAG: Unknown protein [uncultured Aureispira sp.]|uniref:Outer membrane protein beta-barrel domain-containing protein n=1 Tax=uncultured Aureispira sp. TaxID=1331704 RepID=A0A6S6SM55_9BACT|nr:MAG: Unknown protein [uncultured Aureispira sp.]
MILRIICVVLITVCSLGWAEKSTAQIVDLKHAVYAELGGSAGIWSVNYDLMALNINNFKIGARVGFGFMTEGYAGTTIDLHIPLTVNFLYAIKEKHHVELGLGTQIASYEIRSVKTATDTGFVRKTETLGNFTFGYRFQNPDGGFMFRVFYSPFFYQDGINFRYEHWAGLSVGYAFNRGGKRSSKPQEK